METIKVFISYAKEDIDKVRPIYDELERAGYTAWLDRENLVAGQDWKHEISRAMNESSFFLACLSNHSIEKTGFVQKELKMALDIMDLQPEGKVYLLPVRLDDCKLPMKLQHLHYCDVFEADGPEQLLKAIDHASISRGLVWLSAKVVEGPDKGKEFKIPSPSLTIGRTANNDIQLSDGKVSALHAKIEARSNTVVFRHLSEKNPSIIQRKKGALKLEARRINKISLRDGDTVSMGETRLEISIQGFNLADVVSTEPVED